MMLVTVTMLCTAVSNQCFVKFNSSSSIPNMCERAFYAFPSAETVTDCADICVADQHCVMFAWELAGHLQRCRLSATCIRPRVALVGWNGYFRNSTSGKCASRPVPPAPAPPRVPGSWERVTLIEGAKKGAVCIDGSPGVFYIRTKNAKGARSDPTKWVLFMEGGGWASSLPGSVKRAKTDLGSSKNYPLHPNVMEGTSMFNDPTFDSHTIVYAKYCDGGSFTGKLTNPPVIYQNTTLYFRGRGIFDALLNELFDTRGLDGATEFLYSGCSAGGLTTYIHADRLAHAIKARAPKVSVVALADAMFSLNHDDYKKDVHWPDFMSWVYHTMDAEGNSVNQDCVQTMAQKYGVPRGNRSEGWRCMFGAEVAPFIKTPLFVLNSKYDTWQGAQIIGAGKTPITNCSTGIKQFWIEYGHEMVAKLDALPTHHGVYLHNCQSHCQTNLQWWSSDVVNGTSMQSAVAQWYSAALNGTQATVPRWIDRCDEVPCQHDVCQGKKV